MKIILVLGVLAIVGIAYAVWVRPYLKSLPQFAEVWQQEATTWAAIKAWLDGRKTILTAIWGEVIGFGPDVLQIVAGVDLKTAFGLPDNWALLIGGLAVPILMAIFRARARV